MLIIWPIFKSAFTIFLHLNKTYNIINITYDINKQVKRIMHPRAPLGVSLRRASARRSRVAVGDPLVNRLALTVLNVYSLYKITNSAS
jgi:hypothetical protein